MSVKQFIGSEYVTHIEQIHPPQPAESPDDWVDLPLDHVLRLGVGQYFTVHGMWDVVHGLNGSLVSSLEMKRARCRRRDYPQKPVEVHTDGPHVTRSEYERVCLERDNLQEIVKAHEGILLDSIERHGKSVFVGTPNGWPLVPVDPSCIPDGHRAVEVTCATAGKLVASSDGNARYFNGTHIAPRLVVEPIPTPDTLPRPEFPAWIRAGWWVAMDPDLLFWGFENEPIVDEQCGEHTSVGGHMLFDDDQLTISMRSIPANRWREAKWQVE